MAISYNWLFLWGEKHSINGVFLVLYLKLVFRAITVDRLVIMDSKKRNNDNSEYTG